MTCSPTRVVTQAKPAPWAAFDGTSRPISHRSRFGIQRTGHPTGRDPLHPHGLPNTRRTWIPDRVRLELPILLTACLGEIARVVLRPNDDRMRRRAAQLIRHVRPKRRVSAFMASRTAVHPDRRYVIDRPEVQDQALCRARGPADRRYDTSKTVIATSCHTARWRLRGKGNPD